MERCGRSNVNGELKGSIEDANIENKNIENRILSMNLETLSIVNESRLLTQYLLLR
jgi:hypothetical protein